MNSPAPAASNQNSEQRYYYQSHQAILGPYSLAEIQDLAAKNILQPSDRVWVDSFEGPGSTLAELNLPQRAIEHPVSQVPTAAADEPPELTTPLLFHPNFRPSQILPAAGLAPSAARVNYRYADIRFQKNLLVVLLLLNIGLSVSFIVTAQPLLLMAILVLGLFTGVVYLVWVYQAVGNAHSFGGQGLFFTPGWAVASYFLPVFSLFRPYQMLQELWKASSNPANWKNQDDALDIILYWACHWLSIGLAYAMAHERLHAIRAGKLAVNQAAADLLTIPLVLSCCGMALLGVIVTQITNAQHGQRQKSMLLRAPIDVPLSS